jgi:hypothetical protein
MKNKIILTILGRIILGGLTIQVWQMQTELDSISMGD